MSAGADGRDTSAGAPGALPARVAPVAFIGLIVAALILAVIVSSATRNSSDVERTGSLYPAIAVHMALNAIELGRASVGARAA